MLLAYIMNFSCIAHTDEVSTGLLKNWVAEIVSEEKVGVSVCEHERKQEVDSTKGVEINKGNAETIEVVEAGKF